MSSVIKRLKKIKRKMKRGIFICIVILLTSCSFANKSTSSTINQSTIDLAINQLVISFQETQDSILLDSALLLNSKAINLDTLNINQRRNLSTRIQILSELGRSKEAFLLKEKILSNNKADIDRLMYYGMKYKVEQMNDSSNIYFDKALVQCDKFLQDKFSVTIVERKLDIYIFQQNFAQVMPTIDEALVKVSEDDAHILIDYKDNLPKYINMSNQFLESIK